MLFERQFLEYASAGCSLMTIRGSLPTDLDFLKYFN
jgi:hypothetical protein